jgi:2-polyprenyl-3-methyl-5-hydroxy-6-metoxy-1,4-benzoquinol methylase
MPHRTAISRIGLSAPARTLRELGLLKGRVLDYGCGRGGDADRLDCERWDPWWWPAMPEGKFDTILCTYVLNVLPADEEEDILEDIRDRLRAHGGKAYVTVRRDLFINTLTQREIELDLPVACGRKGAFCTYLLEGEKG